MTEPPSWILHSYELSSLVLRQRQEVDKMWESEPPPGPAGWAEATAAHQIPPTSDPWSLLSSRPTPCHHHPPPLHNSTGPGTNPDNVAQDSWTTRWGGNGRPRRRVSPLISLPAEGDFCHCAKTRQRRLSMHLTTVCPTESLPGRGECLWSNKEGESGRCCDRLRE